MPNYKLVKRPTNIVLVMEKIIESSKFSLVPRERLELSRCCHQQILSLPRLPVPPPRQWRLHDIVANYFIESIKKILRVGQSRNSYVIPEELPTVSKSK